jgi:hypothetical protein
VHGTPVILTLFWGNGYWHSHSKKLF